MTECHVLCSENGKYCMIFNQLTPDQNFAYLRIYAQGNEDWLVWVANRDQPVDQDSAVLLLDHYGVLKIESKDGDPIILYSSPQPVNNTMATLLNTGNFVLQQLHPNGTKTVLWQSFDHPTDTLIPGMKLGVNLKTGHNWSLVSWFTDNIPSSGPFRLEWEPRRRELIIRRGAQVYWTSKELGNNRFEHISGEFQYDIVSNENEEYFTLTTGNEEHTIWTLLGTGQLMNRKGNDIARADKCYGYNDDGGCQKWEKIPTCRDPGDEFDIKVGFPPSTNNNITSYQANSSYGPSDCQAFCWSNCSCVGFSALYDNGTGCILWNSMVGISVASSGGQKFYVKVNNTHRKGTNKWIWKSAVIATTLLIICHSILFLALKIRKYKHKEKDRKTTLNSRTLDLEVSGGFSSVTDPEDDLNEGHDLKVFSYSSVMVATNDFLSENKLGEGGFGPVYKGILPTGEEVAVKRLSRTSGQGVVEFKNELALISELQHTNLVQLLGHCIHKQERMLVYEYMPNKSLDFFLFDSTQRNLLDWGKRFRIIEGIAQGLLYLHKYSRLKIIHRDLKASNILLDENMNPKISDFGIARMFTPHESEVNTNKIVGTIGYMSPEYLMEGVFSTKSDIYSFGVLLLEIVSGRKNKSFYTDERPLNLVGHAWELWKQGEVLQLMDPALTESFVEDEVLRCVHAGLLCVEEKVDDRPDMSNVISMLTNKCSVGSEPKRPAYYFRVLEEKTLSKEIDMDCICENSLSHVYSI
ncbi:G-type lectin S-receptor-like serine/threonine-protein kinase At1g67520 [Gastrolobium bilobum]|uniref:G-type lectin S-receptor-like serine/threonine-protein kinase At1g67520 n=1 Tax=Gastrolobium bilobum TaxID=150636 RepID=UPI002AB1B73E|nr:G-type lectin S-receptor-like serine/threonine-protein kinase At1g67520 [Gastrolobium bilobum]